MTTELFAALITFTFVSSITPGPNNMMLMASGANYGFARSLPHMLGVAIGFTIMVLLVGAGLIQVFDAYPISYTILQVFSVCYLSWLAWKIAHSAAPNSAEATGTPFTFLQAAAIQWVNPKAWAMALTATSVYAPERDIWAILFVAAVFGAVNFPSITVWVLLGQNLRRWLTNPTRLRAFNWTMAALLILSVLPVFFH